jgi:type IV secretory pathway TraG/TraD family ATPase VirD4
MIKHHVTPAALTGASNMVMKLATAAWADPALVAEKYLYRDGAIWLGRSATNDNIPIGYQDDRHVCLVSGTRGGKGTSSIINTLLVYPGSVVVIDPKGENATVTAARRGKGTLFPGLGQAVHVLDPFGEAQVEAGVRSRFNPFDALDPNSDESVDEAARLADALVIIHESNDPFWDESARAMVRGLILHVLTAPEYEGRRDLVTMRDLITRGDWEAVQALREMGEKEIASADAMLWDGVARNPAFGGVVAGIGNTFLNMLTDAPRVFQSVLQVANRNTEFIDSPAMQRGLTASDFKLSSLKSAKAGMSLYLCLPQRFMSTHHRWLRMMVSLIVTEMEIVRGRPATGFPVLMILDEFAGLKRMEVIENAVAQMAGYGLKLFFVLQSLEQLKAVYKDKWETFLANAGVKIFFNLEDHFSREYVSKMIGDTEIVLQARSASATAGETNSIAHGTSKSTSNSEGVSSSRGRSDSHGTNYSSGHSESTGTSQSSSSGFSFTLGETHTPGLFGSGLFSRMTSGSNSRTLSDSRSSGTSQGWSRSSSLGRSEGWGTSLTEGETSSRGETSGENVTSTTGTSKSTTAGVNETIQRRPLIYPDEIGQYFATIKEKRFKDYPGVALVLIAGERPIYLRRSYYYEDGYFIGLFSKHPDHGMPRTVLGQFCQPTFKNEWIFFPQHESRIMLSEGTSVRKGQAIGSLYEWSRNRPEEKQEVAAIRSPWEGRLVRSVSVRGDWEIMHYDDNLLTDYFGNAYRDAEPYFQACADKMRAYKKRLEDAKERHKIIEAEAQKKAEEQNPLAQYMTPPNLPLLTDRIPRAPAPIPSLLPPKQPPAPSWLLKLLDRLTGR